MKKFALVTAAALAALVFSVSPLLAQDGKATEGVYTKDQSAAGKTAYAAKCGACHGAALTGGEMAPALAGGSFLSNWNGTTLFDFFDRVRTTMPVGKEGSLSRAESAQITAFVLESNGYPAGQKALPTDDDSLKNIKLDAKK
jgi:S-disulfanyl-L-cysteine oxidoreductase SoxD